MAGQRRISDYFSITKDSAVASNDMHLKPPDRVPRIIKLFNEDAQSSSNSSGSNADAPSLDIAKMGKVSNKENLLFFCDGSCIAGKHAGYSAVFPEHQDRNVCEKLEGKPTNNRAEYMAFIRGIEVGMEIDPDVTKDIIAYSDSELLVNTVTKWMLSWKMAGWRRADGGHVKNLDLVQRIEELLKKRKIIIRHVRAHTGRADFLSKWNDVADKLARKAACTRPINASSF